MRPLKSRFPDHALTTLDTLLKQTKEARVLRRAQAVRAVVAGQHVSTVSTTLPCGQFRPPQMGAALCAGGAPGLAGSPALRATTESDM